VWQQLAEVVFLELVTVLDLWKRLASME